MTPGEALVQFIVSMMPTAGHGKTTGFCRRARGVVSLPQVWQTVRSIRCSRGARDALERPLDKTGARCLLLLGARVPGSGADPE